MFLTRFQLNPTRRGTVRLLGSPQRMHAAVLSAFPPQAVGGMAGRVLWRLDEPARHERNLYIVSPARPSLEKLQDDCGWSQEPSWQTSAYGPFLDRLAPGQRWIFRLVGNPVRSVPGRRDTRGRIMPHVTAEQQCAWLLERADRHGFAVPGGEDGPQLRVTRRERVAFTRADDEQRRRATITRAQYDGILEVRDPELFRTALVHGIGRAKAYGCGLMTLARSS